MKRYLIILGLIALVGFSTARANGFGIKYDKIVGEYIANIDTDTYTFTSGQAVTFSFMLWNQDRSKTVDFDNVWVNLAPQDQDQPIFDGLLANPDFGGFRMTYALPKAGNYTLTLTYGKLDPKGNTQTLVEAPFDLKVEPDPKAGHPFSLKEVIFVLGLGLVAGSGAIFFWKK